MSNSEHNAAKVIGLDIGTSRIVTAQRVNKEYQYQAQLNAFLALPYSKLADNALKKEKIPHKVEGSEMIVFGNEAVKFANLFSCETRRPMTRGILNPNETNSLPILKEIIATVLGEAAGKRHRLCFSVPAAPLDAPDELTYHETTLRQVLTEFGFEVMSVNEGLAVVLAELEDTNYSGIGISCGGGMCNVCLAFLSMPVFSFSLAKAGDFIDASAAAIAGEGATRIRAIKEESFHLNGHFADKVQQALAVYYDDMIHSLVSSLKDAFSQSKRIPRLDRPIPLVISGGSVLPSGFRDRFEEVLNENPLPIRLSEIRISNSPLNSTAKGALVAALAEL